MATPAIFVYTLLRARKDGGKRYFAERLGNYTRGKGAKTDAPFRWVHAASVGEVITVLPLLKALDEPVMVTTTTPTGAAVLLQQKLSHVQHHYLPVDFGGACDRFFSRFNIRSGWIVETEIWPWLYAHARNHNIPLSIINARLSDKTSAHATGIMASTFARALAGVTIFARTENDAQRYQALGAERTRIHTVGNMKYANSQPDKTATPSAALLQRPYLLCASTHEDEELQLAQVWCKQTIDQKILLVIAPRHPERGVAIEKQLMAAGIQCSLRSRDEHVADDAQVYIADTLGELPIWYEHAIACFVGGSLIERGGHNVLEAARAGCPVSVGPHTFNFSDIMQALLEHQAVHVAHDAQEVIDFFNRASSDADAYGDMADIARQCAKQFDDVLGAYLQKLTQVRGVAS